MESLKEFWNSTVKSFEVVVLPFSLMDRFLAALCLDYSLYRCMLDFSEIVLGAGDEVEQSLPLIFGQCLSGSECRTYGKVGIRDCNTGLGQFLRDAVENFWQESLRIPAFRGAPRGMDIVNGLPLTLSCVATLPRQTSLLPRHEPEIDARAACDAWLTDVQPP